MLLAFDITGLKSNYSVVTTVAVQRCTKGLDVAHKLRASFNNHHHSRNAMVLGLMVEGSAKT